ncbi:hypothetical protein LTR53_016036, partial [Teratosphaeriaceae sp. CCFEE 6253]
NLTQTITRPINTAHHIYPAMPTFNPDRDIPSLVGKVILITGGTAGLGAGSVEELAKHEPAQIMFTGRNQKSADALIAKINKTSPKVKVTFVPCDVSSLASVRDAAATFTREAERLDILMLNAGIMAVDPSVSVDGYEIQFATNYLGHALLVRHLLPILQSTADRYGDVRVIEMTSTGHAQAPRNGIDFATLKTDQASLGYSYIPTMSKWARYGQGKLAQMLYSQELAKRYPALTSVSVHPGVILTDLVTRVSFATQIPTMFMKKTPVDEGHYHQCYMVTCPKTAVVNGEYYEPTGVLGKKSSNGKDAKLAAKLWEWTEKELAAFERK